METGNVISEREETTQNGRIYTQVATKVRDGEVEKFRLEVSNYKDYNATRTKRLERFEEDLKTYGLVETGDHAKWEATVTGNTVSIEELDSDGTHSANPKTRTYDKDTFLGLVSNKYFEIVKSGKRDAVVYGDLRVLYEVDKFFMK